MDYSKMTDFEINCEVARAADLEEMMFFGVDSSFCVGPVWNVPSGISDDGFSVSRGNPFNPCNNPADAWPIIEANAISIEWRRQFNLPPIAKGANTHQWHADAKPLRAAMVVYLMMQEAK